ncbi:MAG: 2-oxoglutarate ferredoxin oxidoreductase subunit beta [Chloroflexi bacterium]|nr:MAG: 2-oxoglutarate ferredoxin oxidoreductase subunit beta [Chloroflexota bacterium]
MDTIKKPAPAPRAPKVNALGLEKTDYRGKPSTLCKGCGHDSISQRIVNAVWELGLEQTQVVKFSGIGCSSKTPAYFLGYSHGFNAVHGRMPSVATGAMVANRSLKAIAVSGDGDSMSIGVGQFKHAMRRNVPLVYIVENNGVYGLTKGQFSATADQGQQLKYAGVNELPPLDVCLEALAANATFVARSFAGDAKQVETLLKAALSHRGIAVLDIISPCVTFNNHETSTKSYTWGKEHQISLQELNYVPSYEEIEIDEYDDEVEVQMHDGSWIVLKKLDRDYDPTDKHAAYRVLEDARHDQKLLTGLFYIDEEQPDLIEMLHMTDTPFSTLPAEKLRPSRESLAQIMASL